MTDLKAPWTAELAEHKYSQIYDNNDEYLGELLSEVVPTVLAAPELAARCERLLEALKPMFLYLQDQDERAGDEGDYVDNLLYHARAAIAEAEKQQ